MLIKKETEYALLGLIALSQKECFHDVKVLAKNENISEALLSKAFQKLVRVDILESRIGPGGGFRLKKDPKEIALLEIIKAVQPSNILKCYGGKAPYCDKDGCPVKHTIGELEKHIEKFLSNTTLRRIIDNK